MAQEKESKRIKAEAKYVRCLSKKTGLSGALLAYALHFGIIGIVGKKKNRSRKTLTP